MNVTRVIAAAVLVLIIVGAIAAVLSSGIARGSTEVDNKSDNQGGVLDCIMDNREEGRECISYNPEEADSPNEI